MWCFLFQHDGRQREDIFITQAYCPLQINAIYNISLFYDFVYGLRQFLLQDPEGSYECSMV